MVLFCESFSIFSVRTNIPCNPLDREERLQGYQKVLEALSEQDTERGQYGAAVGWLRRAVAADPLCEERQRCLMHALARSGEAHAVLQVYQQFCRQLQRDDPRALPAPEAQELYPATAGGGAPPSYRIRCGARRLGRRREPCPRGRPKGLQQWKQRVAAARTSMDKNHAEINVIER